MNTSPAFTSYLKKTALPLLLAASWLSSPGVATATDDYVVDTFDSAASASGWSRWWGSAPQTYTWDGTVDANGSATSGSLKVTVDFNRASYGGDNQFAAVRGFPVMDGAKYSNLVFDILWDPSSPQRADDFGWFEPMLRNSDYSQNNLPPFGVTKTPGWIHVVLPINPAAPKLSTVTGVALKMWAGDATAGFTGRATFWVDNVKFIGIPDTVVTPPPTLGAKKPIPGLNIFASAPGAQYQRQSIRTKSAAFSWVGAADPVTYSFTIADYPSGTYSGFQTHLFIVPGSNLPTYETSPDWNEPNVVFLQVANNADGTGYASFRYKTNQPSGNSMLFGAGTIASIGTPDVRGTWNLTFNPDGQISLTAPGGANTNFTMPPDAVSLFSGPAYAYLGVQPNVLSSIGQSAVIRSFYITGVATPVGETFGGLSLDPDTWEKIADDTSGLMVLPLDAALWLSWTLPDKDFSLQYFEDITYPGDAIAFSGTGVQIGDKKRLLLRQQDLPASSTGNYFFRMVKP
ncbi:MAG TPA: hypothetical protein VMZ27_08640 [Candidatus Saccharimonadales bacterium]|nr:hypothetical protein [Candidatus Saccharimonadales bacterium]